jgi:hypothetical protein
MSLPRRRAVATLSLVQDVVDAILIAAHAQRNGFGFLYAVRLYQLTRPAMLERMRESGK